MHRIRPVVSNFLKFSSTVVAVQWNCEASHEVQTQRLDEYFDLGRLLNGGTFDLGLLTRVSENICFLGFKFDHTWDILTSWRSISEPWVEIKAAFFLCPNLFSPFLAPCFLVRRFDWILCLEAGQRDCGCLGRVMDCCQLWWLRVGSWQGPLLGGNNFMCIHGHVCIDRIPTECRQLSTFWGDFGRSGCMMRSANPKPNSSSIVWMPWIGAIQWYVSL